MPRTKLFLPRRERFRGYTEPFSVEKTSRYLDLAADLDTYRLPGRNRRCRIAKNTIKLVKFAFQQFNERP